MDRAKILALIDVRRSRGLEIGALVRPIVTRDEGAVEYVDRTSTEDLRRWYSGNDQVDVTKLVEVDHVWGQETLFDCVGRQRTYDYVVASHVIEHVPDLFGWLGEIASVLIDGGIASFVVPDKRYTFDVLRRTSSESELVDAYVRGLRRPDSRQIFDHFSGFRDVDAEEVRNCRVIPSDLPPRHQPLEVLDLCRRALAKEEYIDTHCWVFTPRSFVEALDLGSRLGLLPFEIATMFPTPVQSHEFFVSLRRIPANATIEDQRAAFLASCRQLDLPGEERELRVLDDLEERARKAEFSLQALHNSRSWRMTAPLRRVATAWRKFAGRRRTDI